MIIISWRTDSIGGSSTFLNEFQGIDNTDCFLGRVNNQRSSWSDGDEKRSVKKWENQSFQTSDLTMLWNRLNRADRRLAQTGWFLETSMIVISSTCTHIKLWSFSRDLSNLDGRRWFWKWYIILNTMFSIL
jgi:hypothetical protein